MTTEWIAALGYILLAPIVGGLLAGLDRIISARMQNRVGPPILQPFYDIFKLYGKAGASVNSLQVPLVVCHLAFLILTGALFFFGTDMLLVIFALTVAAVFFILAAYTTHSPFSFIGAQRELIIIMACEPILLIAIAAIYKVSGGFTLYEVAASGTPLISYLPGVFAAVFFILTLKFRKSPFDISYSHHAHQELVKGITTDLSGRTLALIEVGHWYENVFLYGFVYVFFAFSPVMGAIAIAATYFLEILIDNINARVKWQLTLWSTWLVSLILGGGNLILLYVIRN